MATKYADPEINLLHSFDGRLDAWRISRPYLNPEDINLEDITSMDLEVAGAAVYHFYIKSSIFFRDLLFTVRNGIGGIWARSNRTIPYNEDNLFLSSEYVEHDEYLQKCMDEVYAELSDGKPQDYAKKLLPMAASTEYSLYLDDRTLVTFLKTLKSVNNKLYNVYGKLFLKAIGRDDSYVDKRNCKSIYDSLAISDKEYIMLETGDTSHHVGTMYIGVYEISANLMSQFIRQHYSKVHNELWNYAKNDVSCKDEIYKLRCNDNIVVSLYAEESAFNKVISVRSCEFAQWDKEDNSSWSSIIGGFVSTMDQPSFVYNLPCKGNCNKCGILKDMLERINCVEVNMPCSILTQNPELMVIRSYKYGSDSKIYKMYEKLINFSNRNLNNKYFHKFYTNLQNKLNDHSTKEWDIYKEFYGDPKLLFYNLAAKDYKEESNAYTIEYDNVGLKVNIEDALKFFRYKIFGNPDISQKDAYSYHNICTKLLNEGIVKYSEWLYSLTIVKELCYEGDECLDDYELK